ncbi:MAG: S8 family serine peptidase, partial [Clostridia bacterium]|nr:S8 family serine peptidase [Clostridia bacterium]
SGATVDDVYISAKVPFAYDYADSDADVYPSYSQHGTHVAGIVAGKADSYTNKDGNTATYVDDKGNEVNLPFRGVAPEAQLVICKVFTDDLEDENLGGADAVDILDALEDCYNLNVDVVNMSLGTSAGFSSTALGLTPADEEGVLMKNIYERLRQKGITMMIAASNDYSAGYGSAFGTNLTTNPDSGTVGSPSTFDGAMSVASVNGQYSPYILANANINGSTVTGGDAIYYEESRNEDSDAYNFLNDLLGDPATSASAKQSGTFKYVVVPGTGEAGDYTQSIRNELSNKGGYDKVIAVIKRGISNFKDKIETAKANGADAVIVYNNVSGMIRMSLGDMQEHIPAVSVSLSEGLLLTGSGATRRTTGTITLNREYVAGPFMNDYSSWGSTPDLKLKPDVTSHGGEITSTVAGGYEEMSGTSMACPNLAGFTALLKSYLKTQKTELWQGKTDNDAFALTKLTNSIIMSTATTVYDQNKLPYSPRKQGAGLATLANVFSTNAYLYTDEADGMCDDGRPKAELGEDAKRSGVYNMAFYVRNFGEQALTFTTNSIFMTETVGADGKSVAEKAYLFGDDATWTVGGTKVAEGGSFTVPAGESRKIE